MKPIMVDSYKKVENYMNARGGKNGKYFHEIVPADSDEKVWRQKSSTIGGNKQLDVAVVGKSNARGYISKNGFNPHT